MNDYAGFRVERAVAVACRTVYGDSTALNNGLISAIVSFARTLIFQIGAVLLLPMAFKLNGIWAAIIVAEGLAFVLDTIFLITNKKKYQY